MNHNNLLPMVVIWFNIYPRFDLLISSRSQVQCKNMHNGDQAFESIKSKVKNINIYISYKLKDYIIQIINKVHTIGYIVALENKTKTL